MGYMGSGLQRWIYTQRPRKFFGKDRTNPGNSFDIGTDSGTKVAGRAGNPRDARKRVREYFQQSRRARYISLMTLLGIAMMLGGLAYDVYHAPVAPAYSRDAHLETRHREAVRQQNAEQRQNAYLVLLKSGDEYFQKRQFEWAIEEYSKALDIFPDATEPVTRIANAYKYLCEYYGQSCDQAEVYSMWAGR